MSIAKRTRHPTDDVRGLSKIKRIYCLIFYDTLHVRCTQRIICLIHTQTVKVYTVLRLWLSWSRHVHKHFANGGKILEMNSFTLNYLCRRACVSGLVYMHIKLLQRTHEKVINWQLIITNTSPCRDTDLLTVRRQWFWWCLFFSVALCLLAAFFPVFCPARCLVVMFSGTCLLVGEAGSLLLYFSLICGLFT